MSDQDVAGEGGAADQDPDAAPLLDGARELGPYKLLSVLGEGGMGVVYQAEQAAPLRRRVAIKVLKTGMDTGQVVARFESERQALAVMDHPGIARVFDSGVTLSGRPYFVMELVHGTPITDYADTHRLSTSARLRLFMDVCAAVQHAHMKGVIHRDLKPSNVLVSITEGGPVVKVIDFGIAKAIGMGLTEQTLVTQFGQVIGTPEYMSPEQAEVTGLDVDTRTDVYSLGVMLYELVVGARPFDLSTRPGFAFSHVLRERDVTRPSTRLTNLGETLDAVARHRATTPDGLRREVRGDLDWIILKALEKDRTRRYETANGLRLEIQRHLDHEPVLARPPSTRYRIGKFVRRNRAGVVAAGVALAAVIGGATLATAGLVRAVQERERAERSAETAEQVADFLVNLFSVSDPGEARGNSITAREVLDTGAERIGSELSGQPQVQGRLMRVMGDVYRGLGLYSEAAPLLEQAVEVGDQAQGTDPLELARAWDRLGVVYRELGRFPEAAAAYERSRALSREAGIEGTLEFAVASRGLASAYLRMGRADEAEAPLREALAVQEAQLGPEHLEVGITTGAIAAMHLLMRDTVQAVVHLERALELRERNQGPDHPEVLLTAANVGSLHLMRGDYARAEEVYRRTLAAQQRVLDPDHPNHGMILTNLGEALRGQGRLDDAESHLLQALEMRQRTLGPRHASLTYTLHFLGRTLRDQGRLAEAADHLARALEVYDLHVQQPDAHGREILETYSGVLRNLGRVPEAERAEIRLSRIDAQSSTR
jgi:eukaryotic-like serine/threonine-protein kinase